MHTGHAETMHLTSYKSSNCVTVTPRIQRSFNATLLVSAKKLVAVG